MALILIHSGGFHVWWIALRRVRHPAVSLSRSDSLVHLAAGIGCATCRLRRTSNEISSFEKKLNLRCRGLSARVRIRGKAGKWRGEMGRLSNFLAPKPRNHASEHRDSVKISDFHAPTLLTTAEERYLCAFRHKKFRGRLPQHRLLLLLLVQNPVFRPKQFQCLLYCLSQGQCSLTKLFFL